MNNSNEDFENPALNDLFARERAKCQPNTQRINRIMQKVHHESSIRDLTLMIFVRFWMTLLQMGAVIYVASAKHKIQNQTLSTHGKHQGQR